MVGFYEFLAVALWFLVSRVPSTYGWCVASIPVRVLACSIVASNIWWVGPGLQAALWVIAMIYAAAAGLWMLTKHVRTRLRSA